MCRIKAQMDLGRKKALASFTLDNSRDEQSLREQVCVQSSTVLGLFHTDALVQVADVVTKLRRGSTVWGLLTSPLGVLGVIGGLLLLWGE